MRFELCVLVVNRRYSFVHMFATNCAFDRQVDDSRRDSREFVDLRADSFHGDQTGGVTLSRKRYLNLITLRALMSN